MKKTFVLAGKPKITAVKKGFLRSPIKRVENLSRRSRRGIDFDFRCLATRVVAGRKYPIYGLRLGPDDPANSTGVDLMRNAPTSDRMKGTWLVGGHRISRTLPWIGRPHFRSTPLKMLFLKKPFDREKTLLALTCNSYQGPPMAVHEGAWLKPALLQLFGAIRFRAPEASSVPTLLVKSAHDRLINSKCSERLSKSLGFPIAVHPTAGHDLALDDPEWLIEKILAWDEKSKEK